MKDKPYWIDCGNGEYKCPKCNRAFIYGQDIQTFSKYFPSCPYCGMEISEASVGVEGTETTTDVELIIKVPEKLYKVYKGRPPMLGDAGMDMVAQAVANGTPLPKGHGRLKDENYFLNILRCEEYKTCTWRNCSECNREKSITKRTVLEAPTIVEADRS